MDLGEQERLSAHPRCQARAANPEDFITWIQENEEKKRCSYASVQPFNSYEAPLCLEKRFYDFDCLEDPSRAQEETLDFVERLARFYDIEPLITFSGNKGNHVYIYLEKPFATGNSKQNFKVIYRILQRMLLGNAEYETLDFSVIGDISQLARVPFTHHEKTGKICTPIDKQGKPLTLETARATTPVWQDFRKFMAKELPS
jgi:DNA primase catalytic subunit